MQRLLQLSPNAPSIGSAIDIFIGSNVRMANITGTNPLFALCKSLFRTKEQGADGKWKVTKRFEDLNAMFDKDPDSWLVSYLHYTLLKGGIDNSAEF